MVTGDRSFARQAGRPHQRPPRAADLSFLEPTLWKVLTEASDRRERIAAWLSLLAADLGHVEMAVVLIRDKTKDEFVPAATWPADLAASGELTKVSQMALEGGRGLLLSREGTSDCVDMAVPVRIDERIGGVVALTVANTGTDANNRAFRQLQWATAWIREALLAEEIEAARHLSDKATKALRLFVTSLEEERIEDAARSLVTLLAQQFDCERVSLGFARRRRIKVTAISHTANFSQRLNLNRLVGDAMAEAVDQQANIVFPTDPEDPVAARAHDALARKYGATAIATLPIFLVDRFVGAITFERSKTGARFSAREVDALEFITACLGSVLQEKKANSRPLIVKAFHSLGRQLAAVFGPRHLGRKLAVLTVAALGWFLYVATAEYRVTANARIEGSVQRTIAAPFEGSIRDVLARPGDVVEAGAPIVIFDDRELVLERLRWESERDRQRSEYDRALGERNRADQRIISARIEQANAQIELTEEKLARATVAAPFRGIVIAGDLSQRIGGTVRRGESLMEIAPLTSYRVVLNIDESQIEHARVGQSGELVAAPLPDTPFPVRITKIIPASRIVDGRNVFAAEAEVIGNPDRLRPGMTGIAKIAAGERPLVWVWTRSFIDWLRMFVWRWIP